MTEANVFQIKLEYESLRVGNNSVQFEVFNHTPDDYQEVILKLKAPGGIEFMPPSPKISSLPANSNRMVEVLLYARHPGPHKIEVRSVTAFPAPRRRFSPISFQIDIAPLPEQPPEPVEFIFDRPSHSLEAEEQIRHLKTRKQQLTKNLNRLKEQAAKYGFVNIPLSLINDIEEHEEEIERLEAELAALEGDN